MHSHLEKVRRNIFPTGCGWEFRAFVHAQLITRSWHLFLSTCTLWIRIFIITGPGPTAVTFSLDPCSSLLTGLSPTTVNYSDLVSPLQSAYKPDRVPTLQPVPIVCGTERRLLACAQGSVLALPSLHSVGRDKASPWCLQCSHTGHLSPSHAPSSGLCRRPFSPLGTSLTLNHSSAQVLLEKAHRESPRDLDNEVRPSPVKHGCDCAVVQGSRSLPPHCKISESSRWVCSCSLFVSPGRGLMYVQSNTGYWRDPWLRETLFGRRMPRKSYHYFLHLGLIT